MKLNELTTDNKTYVVYDGECPFCSRYVTYIKFKETLGEIQLVDAREYNELVNEFRLKGFDLNNGMIFIYNNTIHYGDQAVFMMGMLSTPVGIFNKLNKIIFRSKNLTKILYPLLVIGRKLTLILLNRKKI
jgi:predicted DCC family thiol-disulfide oxidoreductase YuxK